ncbi:uncharacterized protein LOC131324026 [Rhododendron vialii]|uniref:uncharacterized protein LOC131324026 n=1 Tax=Rhododendron vialii TaxID=182163 RepID=UPI00265F8B3E|nr:uncharacterized protein LOC131324026 [Rhododendron vialii]
MVRILLESQGGSPVESLEIFMSGFRRENQNLQQDGARIAEIFIKLKMEMDGLNNLPNRSFLEFCRRLMHLVHVFALISKLYDATEWYICQGMRSPVNTHKPSFHVNTSFKAKHNNGKGTSPGRSKRSFNAIINHHHLILKRT